MTAPSALRLLCVSHYFESHSGGVEMVAGQLARALRESGAEVTWASIDASPPPTDIPTVVLRASNTIERWSGLPFPIPGPLSLARLIRVVRKCDCVLVHDGMYPTSIAAILSARLCRRPVILVQHIGRVPAPSIILKVLYAVADRFLTRPMLHLASQVVFISQTTAQHFTGRASGRGAEIIFNGVDAATFRPSGSEHERRLEREQIGWPEERRVMLFVGRFLEKKGLMRLREMARMRPDLHWAFAGWGACNPDDWELPNVSVHRGLSGKSLAPLYRAADLFVLPSRSEGFPLVLQEALACGLQPICCDDAATADAAAADYVYGISNEGSEADVALRYVTAIDELTEASEDVASRARRAIFARNRYSWDAAAKRYRALLYALAAPAKHAAQSGGETAIA